MTHVSSSELRQNLARYLDEASNHRTPIVVTRQSGEAVVMIAEGEYDSLMETVHLLRSPANAARLFASIAEAEAGSVEEHEIGGEQ